MRFKATFRLIQQPRLTGNSKHSLRCYFFRVIKVKCENPLFYNSEASAEITLVAEKKSERTLHGPASSLKEKTLVYPCEKFHCWIPCPCKLCAKKLHYRQAGSEKTDDDFSSRREDFEDHFLYHRAYHAFCKFCINVHEHIPFHKYIVRQTRGDYPNFYDHYVSASSFYHWYVPLSPEKGVLGEYLCDQCDHTFTKKADLIRHETSLHFDEKHKCCICGLQYSRKDSLSQHIQIVHFKEDSRKFQCEGCQEKFSKKSHLTRHSSMPKSCETCDEQFCSAKKLREHNKSIHPAYSCEHCKKIFADAANLRRHTDSIQTKTGIWVNTCELCDIKFCTLKELGNHKKIHKKLSISCDYCEKLFKSKWSFRVHTSNRKEKVCPQCGKTLCNNYDLKVHTNSAHGMKICLVCQIEYIEENYKLHMSKCHSKGIN